MASLGVRGANPIWFEVDLTANPFDDNFYLWVLENTIPYQPASVYHDPNLNMPWTSPIQFLANGTLPNDIYFEAGHVYRLEFRQNNGLQAPSQSDPLIYEVNNYIAGQGGDTPIDTVALTSSNQVTNPQFALISFTSPLTLTGVTDPDPLQIGPGWFLELGGTGNVTLEQVALNNSQANPTNAPYALRLTLTGWDSGEVFLRQRFEQNGMLWANKFVSTSITARIQDDIQNISAELIDSNDTVLAQVLSPTAVNESWNEFLDYGELPATTNPDVPPAAYIDYKLSLPSNVDIYITSIQLIVENIPVTPVYDEDSINRQIDHTYNTAYPIVPVGTVIDYQGFTVPLHYVECLGQAISRQTYNLLFNTVTHVETVTLTNGGATFTVADATNYHIGMPLEGVGVQAATTISNVVGTTITMSATATATGPSDVRFFSVGAGNGTTTFNAPDYRNYVIAQAGGNLFGTANNGIGAKGGASTHTLVAAELPAHVHASTLNPLIPTVTNAGAGGDGFAAGGTTFSASLTTGSNTTTNTPFSIVQLTGLLKKCIRYE